MDPQRLHRFGCGSLLTGRLQSMLNGFVTGSALALPLVTCPSSGS